GPALARDGRPCGARTACFRSWDDRVCGGVAYAVGRSLNRPLADAGETIDAIVRAELDAAPDQPRRGRTEIDRLLAGIDRLADLLREQHRRDVVLIDVDRKRQSARRTNLSNMA